MKKLSLLVAILMAITLAVAGCKPAAVGTPAPATDVATDAPTEAPTEAPAEAPTAAPVEPIYGMVTDAGTIDDKSFNQGTWEGLEKAGQEFGFVPKYLKPTNANPVKADYLREIQNLYDSGYKFMVLPGYKFQSAVLEAQDKYADAKFVCIDYTPANDDGSGAKVGPNTVVIFFAEHESGFLAGVATALQLKEGEIGFIGGMQIPAVQKFNWGFQQGVKYANEKYGTTCTMTAEHVIYQGTFHEVAAGQQLAAAMFDAGCKAIFAAAGGVGVGVINEAKTRAAAGKEVWVVGVDGDQYNDGIWDEANKKSIIITSAMKGVSAASYAMVKANIDGTFPGGQTLVLDARNDGIGLPAVNPNLGDDVTAKVAEVLAALKAGTIVVADKADGLIEPTAK